MLGDAWMPPNFLQVTGKKEKGSAIGALYTDGDGAQWVGKAGSPQEEDTSDRMSKYRKGADLDAVKEKVASDGYTLLSRCVKSPYQVPEVKLADLPLMNQYTQDNVLAEWMYGKMVEKTSRPEATKGNLVHLMSKFVKGFIPMRDLSTSDGSTMAVYVQSEHRLPETVMVEGKEYRLVGAMEVLAASRLLGDTDVLGGGFDNAGVVLSPHDEARVVKIDTGYSFNYTGPMNKLAQSFSPFASTDNSLANKKDIQYANMGPAVIQWDCLSEKQQEDFLTFLSNGIKILRTEAVLGTWFDRTVYGKDHVRDEDFLSLRRMLGKNLQVQEDVYGARRGGAAAGAAATTDSSSQPLREMGDHCDNIGEEGFEDAVSFTHWDEPLHTPKAEAPEASSVAGASTFFSFEPPVEALQGQGQPDSVNKASMRKPFEIEPQGDGSQSDNCCDRCTDRCTLL